MTVSSLSATFDPRRALQVTRYHTWPRIREQSIGEHSMQNMRILLAIWPECPRHMLLHCMKHDLGESASGDPPYPIKALNPVLKKACDEIEAEVVKIMEEEWMVPETPPLTEMERLVFKLAEFIEMFEWGQYEVMLGNSMAQPVVDRCLEGVRNHVATLEQMFEGNHLVGMIVGRASEYLKIRHENLGAQTND